MHLTSSNVFTNNVYSTVCFCIQWNRTKFFKSTHAYIYNYYKLWGSTGTFFFFPVFPLDLLKKKKKKSSKLVRWYATIQHVSVDVTLRSSESEVAFSGTFLEWTPCKTFLRCRTDVKKMKQELLQKLFFMSFKSSDNKLFWHHLNVCN